MVKTGQFTAKCKGDRVIALKRQKITLVGLHPERYQRRHAKNHILAVNVTVEHKTTTCHTTSLHGKGVLNVLGEVLTK